ncbi:MAG: type I-E CRISPR-associated protein Cse2/CasB [Candidatus Promineofilum sp.]|nr:type I-E CRISPR-associated protein Cse2/CasB [Promineifilum sp.]
MNEDSHKERERQIAEFIGNLAKLEDGDRARLKRNAGKSLADSRDVRLLFYSRVAPHSMAAWQEERYFLLATLYPLDKAQRRRERRPADQNIEDLPPTGSFGSFGKSFRLARTDLNKAGIDRRFARLLDADLEDLSFQLRQAVTRLTSEWLPIDWAQLARDLLNWDSTRRTVQRNWARDYVAAEPQKQEPQTN